MDKEMTMLEELKMMYAIYTKHYGRGVIGINSDVIQLNMEGFRALVPIGTPLSVDWGLTDPEIRAEVDGTKFIVLI